MSSIGIEAIFGILANKVLPHFSFFSFFCLLQLYLNIIDVQ